MFILYNRNALNIQLTHNKSEYLYHINNYTAGI